jgi:hypothetical protein
VKHCVVVCGREVSIISVLGMVFMFVIQLKSVYMKLWSLGMILVCRSEGSEFDARSDLCAGFSAYR